MTNRRPERSLGLWKPLAAFCLAACWFAPAPAQDAPQQAKSLGPLAEFLLYGDDPDGPWIGQTDGNGYRLINPDDEGAITYFYLQPPPADDGKRTLEVTTVVLQGDGMAGLLYGFTEQPKQYHLVTVDAGGQVTVFHRPPEGGLSRVFGAMIERNDAGDGAPAGPAPITFRLVEKGGTARVDVNGVTVGTIDGPGAGSGGLGIAAAGRIDTLFLDFKLGVVGGE
ncbi:MAG: hypothetical protein AAF710_03990 [Planctomycetota bacterium]